MKFLVRIASATVLTVGFLLECLQAQAQSVLVGTSSTPSVSMVTESSTFNTSPRTLRGRLVSVNVNRHSLLLAKADGQKIELAVPARVPIYSASKQPLNINDLQPGTTFQVRYNPLTVEAIDVQESNE